PHTQRSLGDLQTGEVMGLSRSTDGRSGTSGHLCDYLGEGGWTVLVEPEELHEQGKHFLERVADVKGLFSLEGTFQQLLRLPSIRLSSLPTASVEATCHLRTESVERFSGDVAKLRAELDSVAAGNRIVLACHNEAEKERLGTILSAKTTGRAE